jgi:UDP-N-acetylmuramoylalanine--D-glutamate ligase
LIHGGRGKKTPYAPLASLVRAKARKLILIGEDAETIAGELAGEAPLERARDMKDAVAVSFQAAKPGDIVLLAPACASFDMFENFEDRGRTFKKEVQNLTSKVRSYSS